ncbi:MAG: FAD-dependent oxidoreductase [Candidatus Aminicenantales bacterium]
MKRAVVVGSGAAGAAAAKALQGTFAVTVLERGGEFRPLGVSLKFVEKLKRLGILFDERLTGVLFPSMRIERTDREMIHVRGLGTGGTTPLATGNALRLDGNLRAMGIDLDAEFGELGKEIPIHTDHRRRWRPVTEQVFSACSAMGFDPRPLPKMSNSAKCVNCGRCVLGCPAGAKWDARHFLRDAADGGAEVVTGCRVTGLRLESGRARGVVARRRGRRVFYPADLVILAAGGIGSPGILEDSGIPCRPTLFVDPVLCVAAEWPGAKQNMDIPMPFVVDKEGFIIAPYFDYLSYFFNRAWKPKAENTLSLMIKLADDSLGIVSKRSIRKSLTPADRERMNGAVRLCHDIFAKLGVRKERTFLGTLNAGHPGGMLPLTPADAATLHNPALPENVYVADPTLFPAALGRPPILTIMALARKVCRTAAAKFA